LSYLGQDDTLLTISLNHPLAVDDQITLAFSFVTTIPTDPTQSYGMFKYDTTTNTYALAHWLPLLAGWDVEAGWNTGPISVNGDPVFTEAATFDVRLEAPADLVFATSGSAIDEDTIDGDTSSIHFTSGPSRDFDMSASAAFVVTTATAGETTIRSFALPGSEDEAEVALRTAQQAVESFNSLIGEYPYEELDVMQVEVGNGAGGVEFPGMVFIGADFYDLTSDQAKSVPHLLEFIVAHEVAHQWFYNVIGNDQYMHAFMDEAMANYMTIVYFSDVYDANVANEQANYQLRSGYLDFLFKKGDQVIDQPTDAFPSMGTYGVIIYGKGALAFMELRREIGTDAFFAALQQYFRDFAYKIATPADMRGEFEQASGKDLTEFWTHWFDEADGPDDFDATDLARLLRERK
jgi:aminopeptidase N